MPEEEGPRADHAHRAGEDQQHDGDLQHDAQQAQAPPPDERPLAGPLLVPQLPQERTHWPILTAGDQSGTGNSRVAPGQ